MVSPLSRGLFHRAIAMSGSSTTPIPPQREQIQVAKKHAKLMGCTTDTRPEMFECLKEKPAEEFGKTVRSFLEWNGNPTLVWYPAVEPVNVPGVEAFLPDEPEKLMRQGQIYHVPLIIGVTRDEFSFMATSGIWSAMQGNDSYFQELNDNWYELAPICFGYERHTDRSKYISDELRKYYFNDEPLSLNNSGSLRKNLFQLYANALVHFPVYRAASLISQFSPAPVYFYEFTQLGRYSIQKWPDTGKPKGGVAHGDDLQYIFNIESDAYNFPKSFPFYNGNDSEVVWINRWTSIWSNFAEVGAPLPKNPVLFDDVIWERLQPNNKKYLNLGEEISLQTDFEEETMRLWDKLFP
ncbi:esterase FE4-like [Phymastichus coffea]|uniref:esterase FE4-like n=1 Tax=Phymastichus coffea TaxID=108790 RepID=UPI00273B84BC|nr:esterase FE4-like [Phymastichus coffea]